MICMVIAKNSPLFSTNKSESFARRKSMKLKRHKNTKPPKPYLWDRVAEVIQGAEARIHGSIPFNCDQTPSFQLMSELQRETQLIAFPPSALISHEPLQLEKPGFPRFHCCVFSAARAAQLRASPAQDVPLTIQALFLLTESNQRNFETSLCLGKPGHQPAPYWRVITLLNVRSSALPCSFQIPSRGNNLIPSWWLDVSISPGRRQ